MTDPFCLESNPRKLKFADITSAAYKIKDGIVLTPCMVSTFVILCTSVPSQNNDQLHNYV